MFKILRQPFPREHSTSKKIINAILSGFIVAFFLRVFSPFGFAEAPVTNINLFAAGYGVVTSVVILLFILFETAFPKLFLEEKWTVGKNILVYIIIIFLIGTANVFYTSIATGMEISFRTFIWFQVITLSVTFIVVSAMTMIRYFRSMDFYKKDAVKMSNEVNELVRQDENKTIIIRSENEKENLQLLLNDLLYIEAADNYSKVVFRKDNRIISTLIRSSLKRLEDQFSYPELFRCHRTYIVQLRNVERVSGNSQGYRLHFKGMIESIPVSRKSGDDVHDRLNVLKNAFTDPAVRPMAAVRP